MVEFLTLFLVLATGPRPVELAVAGPVAEVEVLLDGESVATLHGEPWSTLVDLGEELAPRELVAVARDDDGEELDRTTQWVNVAVQPSGASMSLVTDGDGRPRAVSLRWESVGRREPEAIAVTFDGEPLDASDPARIPLPPYDEDTLHFVSAEIRFSERLTTRLDAGFGGRYGEALTTALTPVPVIPGSAGVPGPGGPSPFVRDGVPLKVHTVEKGDARVVVVRDPTAQPFLDHLATSVPEGRATLGGSTLVSFVSPRAAPLGRRVVAPEGFLHSARLPAGDEPLLGLLRRQRPLSYPVHLASAVALAGMEAHATQGRRAVLLLLGEEPGDASPYTPGEVRSYLQRLRVPLHVWSVVGDGTSGGRRAGGASAWGETRYAGDVRSWADAVAELRRDLSSQRVVWLEGRHPLQAVELAGDGHGLRLTSTLDRAPVPTGVPTPAEAPDPAPATPEDTVTDPLAGPLPGPVPGPLPAAWDGPVGDGLVELFSRPTELAAGSWPVELVVLPPAAEVGLVLDGETAGVLRGEPWALDLDLGPALTPHRLVAVARDREGRELERTGWWLNLFPPAPPGPEVDFPAEVTPVAVVLEEGAALPEPKAMEAWFLVDGRPLEVVGVALGPAEVVIVREPSVQPRIDALAEREVGTTYGSVAHLGAGSEVRFVSPLSAPVARVASDRVYFSRAGPYLESTPAPEAVVGTLPGGSPGPSSAPGITGDLLRLAHRIATPTPRRLADAVAVAGMELHGAGGRRAVVLAVEEERPDESLFDVPTVRSYLCDLQVPLVLWSVAETRPKPDADWGPGWGAPEWLGTPSWPFRGLENFAAALGGLRRRLEAQRIVYLAGRHLPRSIALGPRATGIRLAGRTDACGGGPP